MLTLTHIRDAHTRIKDKIHRTPVLTSATLWTDAGAELFFKCENFQRVGAFKARGATNAVFSLSEGEAARGVATHSSGNHAAAVARAARLRGIPAHIVMPSNTSKFKKAAVTRYGARIVYCEPTLEAREAMAAKIVAVTSATFIHPYDDYLVMAGQGTAALELLEDVSTLDAILCPVGGGGLLSGTAVVAKSMNPSIKVFGVEPEGADDAYRSLKAGRRLPSVQPNTIADGLLTSLGEKPFVEIERHVDDIVTVSEHGIVRAMRTLWDVLKLIIEPSGAVAYAAITENKLNVEGWRVGILITGGNLDLDGPLPWQRRDAP